MRFVFALLVIFARPAHAAVTSFGYMRNDFTKAVSQLPLNCPDKCVSFHRGSIGIHVFIAAELKSSCLNKRDLRISEGSIAVRGASAFMTFGMTMPGDLAKTQTSIASFDRIGGACGDDAARLIKEAARANDVIMQKFWKKSVAGLVASFVWAPVAGRPCKNAQISIEDSLKDLKAFDTQAEKSVWETVRRYTP